MNFETMTNRQRESYIMGAPCGICGDIKPRYAVTYEPIHPGAAGGYVIFRLCERCHLAGRMTEAGPLIEAELAESMPQSGAA